MWLQHAGDRLRRWGSAAARQKTGLRRWGLAAGSALIWPFLRMQRGHKVAADYPAGTDAGCARITPHHPTYARDEKVARAGSTAHSDNE
jgi:hypothetical protein